MTKDIDVLHRYFGHRGIAFQRGIGRSGRQLVRSSESSAFLISDWTITEISSALSLKRRAGSLSVPKHLAALSEFRIMAETSFEILPVSRAHFQTAANYTDLHDLGLRSGDALHLAVAMEADATIVTLDKRFAIAAKELSGSSLLL